MSDIIHNAEILCIGTELLLGDIVNTNAAYLSQKLASLGIGVYRQTVVGDNVERLKLALGEALSRADLVITSGGLGPTYDDLTKETVAEYFGRAMHTDESVLAEIERYFKNRYGDIGRMTDNNRKQALVPDGATVLKNPNGTAPGIAIEGEGGKTVIMLPGPPREFEPMVDNEVLPYLAARRGEVFFSRNIHIMGMGESAVENELRELMEHSANPTVAPYAKDGECRLRITARAADEASAAAMCDKVVEEIFQTAVGEHIYGVDVGKIEMALVAALADKGLTLSTAESCTGGLIAKRITDVAGSSAVFFGGVVTYTNEMKELLLGVKHETLSAHTAVSEQVAAEMAEGVRARLGTDIGISTTGYAGPSPSGDEDNPVGTVYVGISSERGTEVTRFSFSGMRSREYIRTLAAGRALLLAFRVTKELQSRI
ncbi:MAG: competence/damage-inducible protein A [Clostridia bacterium]|nr:competence/damage-inducible protein A [Clostridia bacterium]